MRDETKTREQLVGDLAAAREQRRELEHALLRERVLRRLQSQIVEMTATRDLELLLNSVRLGLGELGVPFGDCGVNLVDAASDPVDVHVHCVDEDMQRRDLRPGPAGAGVIVGMWRSQQVAYRRDLAAEDPYGEADRIRHGKSIRAIVDVPFRHGTLAVNSCEPDAFSPEHIEILQDMAQVLSEGLDRMAELRDLEQRHRELSQSSRLLQAFTQIGLAAQQSLDERTMLAELSGQIVEAGLFRCLVASIVDRERHCIEEIHSIPTDSLSRRDLDGSDILARVVQTGEMTVVVGWDEEAYTRSADEDLASYDDKVAYFIPIKMGDRVLGVLATASTRAEKADTLRAIEVMQPLVDQVAIALERVRLHQVAERELARRRQAAAELRASEERYRTFVEHFHGIAFRGGMDFVPVFFHGAVEEITGYTADEFMSGNPRWDQIIHPDDLSSVMERVSEARGKPSPPGDLEHRIVRKDGQVRWVRQSSRVFFDDSGRPTHVDGAVYDITERRLMRRHREAVSQVRDAVWEMMDEGDLESVLDVVGDSLRHAGLPFRSCGVNLVEDMGSESSVRVYDPASHTWEQAGPERGADVILPILREGVAAYRPDLSRDDVHDEAAQIERILEAPVRSVVDVPFSGGTLAVSSDQPDAFSETDISLLRDMAGVLSEGIQRVSDLVALRQSERRFRNLVENATDVIYTHDLEGNFTSANPAASRIFGYAADEISSLNLRDVVDPHHLPVAQRKILQKLSERESESGPYELLTHGKDGSSIWVEVHSRLLAVDGQPVAVEGIARDITPRRQMESQLTIQRDLAMALNATPDLQEGLRLCLQAAFRVSGMDSGGVYLAEEATGGLRLAYHQGLSSEFVTSTSSYEADSPNVRLIMAGRPIYTASPDLHTSRDQQRQQEALRAMAIVPICHQGRVIACMNVASHTLAEMPAAARGGIEAIAAQIGSAVSRLQVQEALRKSEARYQDLYDNAPDMFVSVDARTARITQCNRTLAAELGYSKQEMVGQPVFSLYHPDCQDRVRREIFPAFARTGSIKAAELQLKRRDGTRVDVSLSVSAIRDNEGRIVESRSVWRDITQQKEAAEARRVAEQSLLQSSRLIALGQMAAGMAHELNQPLTAISVLAEGLQARLRRGIEITVEHQLRWSRQTLESVERITRLIEHLRLFSRDGSQEPHAQVSLNEVVRGTLAMTRAQLQARGVEVAVDLADDLVPILGDQYRLEQVLINLIHNGRDAVEEKRARLSESERAGWQMRLGIRTRRERDQVVVEVEDNGVGMGEESQIRALEPFYTTKGPDRGTGLGLSISHAIVKDHGGEIECESREGEGSVFQVRLPLSQ